MKIQNSKFKLQRNIKIQASRAWVVCAMGLCASGFAGFTAEMPRVTITQDADSFRISNGLLMAEVEKSSGVLVSLRYQDLEMLAQGGGGAEGGYWSSVG